MGGFIWGVNGHPTYPGTASQQIGLLHGVGLTSYRVGIYDATSGTVAYLNGLKAAASPLGITILPCLVPNAAASTTNAAAYRWGHDAAFTLATQLPGMMWEIGNELDEFCIKAGASGQSPSDYDDTLFGLAQNSIKGMADGLIAADPNARSIVDIAGLHYGFLQRLRANSVTWDITGLHYYAAPGSTDLNAGAASLFAELATFGCPIAVTEFNQQGGSAPSQQSESDTIINLMNAIWASAAQYNVIAAYIYELLDEPSAPSTETAYGIASSSGVLKIAGQSVKYYLSS